MEEEEEEEKENNYSRRPTQPNHEGIRKCHAWYLSLLLPYSKNVSTEYFEFFSYQTRILVQYLLRYSNTISTSSLKDVILKLVLPLERVSLFTIFLNILYLGKPCKVQFFLKLRKAPA